MERLRRPGRDAPSAATQRLFLAIALSLGLHAFLLHQYAAHFNAHIKSSARPGLSIIGARIADLAPAHPGGPNPLEKQPSSVLVGPAPPSPAVLPVAEPVSPVAVLDEPVSGESRASEAPSIVPEVLESVTAQADASAADIPDPVHYPAKELDVYPRLLGPLAIVYPETVRQQEGRVVLLLLVDASGRVTGANVIDAQPEGVYEDAVTRAYSAAAFSPARKDGRAVRSRLVVAVEIASSALSAQPDQ